jgi:hypothetical protein
MLQRQQQQAKTMKLKGVSHEIYLFLLRECELNVTLLNRWRMQRGENVCLKES